MNAFAHLDLFDGIPAKCPVKGCPSQLTPQELLAHLLMRHRPEDSMLEIGSEWHTVYDLDLAKLTPGCNHVVGVIAYAGSNNSSRSRPISPELQLVHHLPIILMLYVSPPAPNLEQMYVLYLISPVASRKVTAHVSLLHGPEGREVRGLRCLRNFLDAPLQDSEELLHSNMDYLIYTATDVWENCTTGDRCKLQFKVVLHGDPDLFEADDDQKEDSLWFLVRQKVGHMYAQTPDTKQQINTRKIPAYHSISEGYLIEWPLILFRANGEMFEPVQDFMSLIPS